MIVTHKMKNSAGVLRNLLKGRESIIVIRHKSQVTDIFKCHSNDNVQFDDSRFLSEDFYNKMISTRASRREPALTRQITSLAYKMVGKQFISLAEGMPNEDVFPFSKLTLELKNGENMVMEGNELNTALQYIPSQGLPQLLTEIRSYQNDLHRPPCWSNRDVLITCGSQDGIYKCVDLLLEPGDPVLVQMPTYNGIDIVIKPYDPEIIGIPEDAQGTIPEAIESALEDRIQKGLKMPKLMYIVPTGSNPTGAIITNERRQKIYDLACKYNFFILEDDAYMFINYTGKQVNSFMSIDVEGRVLRLDSLSKVLSSGLRAAWITAPKPLLERLELHMQSSILHSSTLSQAILYQLMQKWGREGLASHLVGVREMYRVRRDALHAALTEHISELAEWRLPDAGIFFWVKVKGLDDVYNMVFRTAFDSGLMLAPGQACTLDSRGQCPYLRLALSKTPAALTPRAAATLADVIRRELSGDRQRVSARP